MSLLTSVSLSLTLTGCQQTADDGDDIDIPSMRVSNAEKQESPELATDADTEPTKTRGEIEQVGARTKPREGNLAFVLKPGDRFPLQKTIDQTLAQNTPTGVARSQSKLTMMFAITVEREEEGRRLLNVKYQRVRYSHDLLGDRVNYDSQRQDDAVPDAALLYRGMVNNGFQFWLAQDNRMAEVVDFQGFLQRCVSTVHPSKQKAILAQVASNPDDEGFANFVDDSIGLLRFSTNSPGRETAVKEGDEWTRTRKLIHPLPMAIHTTYALTQLTDTLATIEVMGKIVPARVAQMTQSSQKLSEAEIVLKDGHTHGRCVIDRATGLPIRSQVTRNLALRVRMPDRAEFDQNKQIVTTVEAFPSAKPIYTGKTDGAFGPEIVPTGGGDADAAPVESANFALPPLPEPPRARATPNRPLP